MSLLGNVLKGIGSYLVQKEADDSKQAQADLLFRREVALKQLEWQHDDANAQRDQGFKIAQIDETGNATAKSELLKGVIEDNRQGKQNTFELNKAQTLENDRFGHEKALAVLGNNLGISKAQAQAQIDKMLNGTKPDHWEVQKDGRMAVWSADGVGKIIGEPGQFAPHSQPATQGDLQAAVAQLSQGQGGNNTGGKGNSGNSAAATTPPPAKPPADPKQQLLQTYNTATPDQYPNLFQNGQKIPFDQVMKNLNQGR